ncbi:MAG: alpha/beta hydrolase, partial [Cyanobacteria bacterium J06659_2]
MKTAAISLLSGVIATLPARSADEIYFDYGPFGRVLPASSLEAFAEDGTIDAELAPYLNRLPSEGQQELQRVLGTPIPALSPGIPEGFEDPFFLSQWLYSPIGESVLTGLGQLIQTQGRQNGYQAIRAAIVLAAADPAGLSLINIIRFYPTGGLRLDLQEILALSRALNANIDTTERLIDAATQVSEATAATDPALDYSALPVPAETGQFG